MSLAVAPIRPGVTEDLTEADEAPDGATELTVLLTSLLLLALDMPLGRPLSLIKGTNEVGVLDSCVSGADDDTPDSTVLEACDATENTPGLALPLADSVTTV